MLLVSIATLIERTVKKKYNKKDVGQRPRTCLTTNTQSISSHVLNSLASSFTFPQDS